MTYKEKTLRDRIEKTKRELVQLGDLRMGTLSEQYNVCGTPGCRCKASPPERHGPYHQLSYSRKGKGTTRFIRRESLSSIKKQLRNHARLRKLMDRWIDLEISLSDLGLEKAKKAKSRGIK